MSGEKFANQQNKLEIFIKRLEQAKLAFLNHFLIPEIKRIAKSLSFKNFPTPYFDSKSYKDDISYTKIYAHLCDIGVLTPDQTINAIQNNRLPEIDELEPSQEAYKKQRDSGLFNPLIGGPKSMQGSPGGNANGRPQGSTGIPQSTKKISPMGTSKASEEEIQFSVLKLKDNLILAQEVQEDINKLLKKKYKLKKLNEQQESVASDILSVLVTNEEPENWSKNVKEYVENPVDKNFKRVGEVLKISETHQVDSYIAGLLLASIK
jgi:hypothetical protein